MTPPSPNRPAALVTAPLGRSGLARLSEVVEVVHEPWIDGTALRMLDDAALAARVDAGGFRVVVVEGDVVGAETLSRPLLAVGAVRGDPTNVDLAAATAAGVPVLHTPGRNADAVAEHTLGLLLAVLRHTVDADHEVRAGEVWRDGTIPYQRHRGGELAGRTAAVLGLGAVGQAVAWRLQALGVTVRAYDPLRPDASHDLAATLAGADICTIHAARGAVAGHLVGAAELAMLARGAVVCNTARGALLDTEALVDALRAGHLAGAGIDHVEGEAPPPDHPLLSLPGVVVTPHIGGATVETEGRGAAMVADDLGRLLSGRSPQHCANPAVLDATEVRA
ncbi:MAG TPA: NAD(P)-dependent oxidoreductase [Acidimicrobiales bacterium]|nr:NAD(P)-dependent oxidoreductase [Acidimicrobiales bacterium]